MTLISNTFDSIGTAGFEPTTPTTPKWCATKLRYAPDLVKVTRQRASQRRRFSRLSSTLLS